MFLFVLSLSLLIMSKENIEELLKKYNYGRYNLSNGKHLILESYEDFLIKDFYNPPHQTNGECTDLSEHFHINNEFNTIRVFGHDPEVFAPQVADHAFLVRTSQELGLEYWSLSDEERIAVLKKENGLIIDPSLKYVGNFKDSNYIITQTICQKFADNDDLLISKKEPLGAPIFNSKETGLVELTSMSELLVLTFRKPNSQGYNYIVSLNDVGELEKVSKLNDDFKKIVFGLQKSYESRKVYTK